MGGGAEREHRRYSPSQSERFLACPGSIALIERVPIRETSEYAIEGTKAHDVLEAALQNGVRRALQAHREFSTHFAEDFTSDFYYSLQVALNYVYGILDEYPDAVLYCETFVDPPLPAAPGEAGGYSDIGIWIPSISTLYVIDYKHGAGVAKDAIDNTQPLQYAAGFLYQENPLIDPSTVDHVVCVIVQPRAFHVLGPIREWPLTPYEVYEYLDVLNDGVIECQSPTAALVPGDHCHNTFCNARTVCPAREAMGLQNAVNVTFKSILQVKQPEIPDARNLDVGRLAHIAQWAPFLRKFLDDVDVHLGELLRMGYDVPNFKLVEAQARRKWYGDENELAFKIAALANTDVASVMDVKLMGITDAEKLVVEAFKARVGRGKKKQAAEDAKQMFAQLTLKQSSGNLVVAPIDDPRPAANRAAAMFQGVGELVAPQQNTE